jgi:Fe-S oxidoreductase
METTSIIFLIVLAGSFGLFAISARRLLKTIGVGKAEDRFDFWRIRLRRVVTIAFGQTKLLREPGAGILHVMIFWGFIVLLAAVFESFCQGFFPSFSFSILGPLYPPLAFSIDLFGLLVVGAVVVSIPRRLFFPPYRLRVEGHSKWDAVFILALILVVMVTMFGQNAARLAMASGRDGSRFIAAELAPLFAGEKAHLWFAVFFWGHIVAVLGFLNYLPYSKHLHVLTSVPNVYLSDLGPRGALKPINLADETLTKFGATDVEDLTWKQILNGFTCTECGRCTSACPAHSTGKMLNPKKVIVDVRARAVEKMKEGGSQEPSSKQLLDGFITEQELWACTTCMACVQECPVMIEHVDTIVDLRRGLVLNESRFPEELKPTFDNLERNFTPWGFGHASRGEWAEGLGIRTMADVGKAEYLFWVGCAGAYDARYRKVSRAVVRLLQLAGIDFGILGGEEKCTGDPPRRMGNEYLAQNLISENIATLNRYGVRNIIVTCPHCLQSLGKEYKQFGGQYNVVHHTVFLKHLLDEGKLYVRKTSDAIFTYHDPCYLGRYHSTYDEPRDLLDEIGARRREMRRSKDRSFCCGAGGGRMWMEEREGKRVNIERTEEVIVTGASVVGTACPFCMTMLTDGLKEKGSTESIAVKDIAEILLEAVEGNVSSDPSG